MSGTFNWFMEHWVLPIYLVMWVVFFAAFVCAVIAWYRKTSKP